MIRRRIKTLRVDEEFHKRMKQMAAMKGKSILQYSKEFAMDFNQENQITQKKNGKKLFRFQI